MKYLKKNDYFETTDISLVTTICYFGGQIEAIDKTNASRAKFLIKRNEMLDDVINL